MKSGVTTDVAPPDIAPATSAPGVVIAGRYRLDSRLGSGGGGTVWRCVDDKLQTVVAIKIVRPEGDVERWRREVAMARQITDRNVCRVHDLGETGDLRFVTMELVEGTSLRDRIGPKLAAGEARALFRQIVSGVAAIHSAGVVHRDLKPENVVVATDGRAVIVDFGLAREPHAPSREAVTRTDRPNEAVTRSDRPSRPSHPEVTSDGMAVGTPRYMSPEQAAGEPVDARTDVWALGLLGHELVCGALPGIAETGARVVDRRIDPALSGVLRRCLATSPDDRFVDARELAVALSARSRSRWPWRVAIGVVGALAVVAVVVAVVVASTRATPGKSDRAPFRMQQITATERKWPAGGAISIAMSPDAQRIAYTTGDGKLYVRGLDAGDAEEWTSPKRAGRDSNLFVASWATGFFSDGSIAQLGSTFEGEWQLVRVDRTGQAQLLYKNPQRFTAAVSPASDAVAIGIDDYAVFVVPAVASQRPNQPTTQIITIGRGEQVMALAWSPDGRRLAVARMPADARMEAVVQVMSSTGAEISEIWRGQTRIIVDTLLVWLDNDRLALSRQDPQTRKTTLSAIDVATRSVEDRDTFDDYVGIGSSAHGIVAVLRGTARYSVQLGDRYAERLVPLHDSAVQAGQLAGWTTDGHVVFAIGQPGALQIVRAIPGGKPEAWPDAKPGVDRADTIVDDSVIAHHQDGDKIVFDRIGPMGTRTRVVESPALDSAVRCAGDRAAPCVIVETEGNTVRFTALDPLTGARGPLLHHRQLRERYMRDAALSVDGEQLAIVDGGDQVTVIDIKTGTSQRPLTAGTGAALQSVAFGSTGGLWATSIGFKGRLFGLMAFPRIADGDRPAHLMTSAVSRGASRDSMRWYWRPAPNLDDTRVAVAVREFHLEVWRIDGL